MKQNKADYLIAAQFATNAEQCGDLKKQSNIGLLPAN